MSTRFNATKGLIIARTRVFGPKGVRSLRFALDTGATTTLVNASILIALGYDPAGVLERAEMTTGSSLEYVPRLPVARIRALGQERTSFTIVAHTLPPSAPIDGLLGLDFFRGQQLVIDFRSGQITIS